MGALAFNADEIFLMAEQIERNGGKFYRTVADQHTRYKELFLKLAKMEDLHLKVFSEMHGQISGRESEPVTFDPDNEAAQYAQAMADNKVFDMKKDPTTMLTGKESLADIIKFAVGMEKDSIIFYLGVKGMIPRAAGKDKIDLIINEEMSHISWLMKQAV